MSKRATSIPKHVRLMLAQCRHQFMECANLFPLACGRAHILPFRHRFWRSLRRRRISKTATIRSSASSSGAIVGRFSSTFFRQVLLVLHIVSRIVLHLKSQNESPIDKFSFTSSRNIKIQSYG